MKKPITLCDHPCPLSEHCALYCPTMNRRRTFHFDPSPWNKETGKCSHFQQKEADEPPPVNPPNEQQSHHL